MPVLFAGILMSMIPIVVLFAIFQNSIMDISLSGGLKRIKNKRRFLMRRKLICMLLTGTIAFSALGARGLRRLPVVSLSPFIQTTKKADRRVGRTASYLGGLSISQGYGADIYVLG